MLIAIGNRFVWYRWVQISGKKNEQPVYFLKKIAYLAPSKLITGMVKAFVNQVVKFNINQFIQIR